ncbi:hypothetical protein PALU110988_27300 [Paenibacillus lupini]|nr:hypothetical protein [Paenibacillus lupini]NIK24190.1 hypothetical protein [Paenibacillus lupini]
MKHKTSYTEDVEEFNAAVRQLWEAMGLYRIRNWLSAKLESRSWWL